MSTRWAEGYVSSLEALTSISPDIFVATVDGSTSQRLETRVTDASNNDSTAKPGSGTPAPFPITTYHLRVERVIKGSIAPGDEIPLDQPGGLIRGSNGQPVRVLLENDELLNGGGTYLFFARTNANGAMSAPPYGRFLVSDGQLVAPDGWSWTAVSQSLDGLTVVQAENQVSIEAN